MYPLSYRTVYKTTASRKRYKCAFCGNSCFVSTAQSRFANQKPRIRLAWRENLALSRRVSNAAIYLYKSCSALSYGSAVGRRRNQQQLAHTHATRARISLGPTTPLLFMCVFVLSVRLHTHLGDSALLQRLCTHANRQSRATATTAIDARAAL